MGVIKVEIPQRIKRKFRIKNKDVASAILRQLKETPDAVLQELSNEIDRWEREQDQPTSTAV